MNVNKQSFTLIHINSDHHNNLQSFNLLCEILFIKATALLPLV